jgi:hypothetical protein
MTGKLIYIDGGAGVGNGAGVGGGGYGGEARGKLGRGRAVGRDGGECSAVGTRVDIE